MLKVTIYMPDETIWFVDEIEDISWSLRNPEGTPFNVSMPRIAASIVLHSTVPQLSNIRPLDKVTISNDVGEEMLTLSVISVSVFHDRGKTEIACSGKPIKDLKLGEGSYVISDSLFRVGYDDTLLKLSSDRVLNPRDSYIRTKEEQILAYLWGGDRLMHLTPSQVTGGDRAYDWTTFEEDSSAPKYRILPEQIVSFDTAPADPLISDLIVRERGVGARVAIEVDTAVSRLFVIGGKDIYAVYERRMSGATAIQQALIWSDGIRINLGPTKVNVIGIFSDSYVTLTPISTSATIQRIDKYTGELVVSNTLENYERYFNLEFVDSEEDFKEMTPTITTEENGVEFLWFSRVTAVSSVLTVGLTKDLQKRSVNAGAVGVFELATVTPNMVAAGYVSALYGKYDDPTQTVTLKIIGMNAIAASYTQTMSGVVDTTLYRNGLYEAPYRLKITDGFMERVKKSSPQGMKVAVTILADYEDERGTWVVTFDQGMVDYYFEYLDTRFVNSRDPDVLYVKDALLIQVNMTFSTYRTANLKVFRDRTETLIEISVNDYKRWVTLKGNIVTAKYGTIAMYADSVYNEGDIKNIFTVESGFTWGNKKIGAMSKVLKLRGAEENAMMLPYVIDNIGSIDVPIDEIGRMTIGIARFSYDKGDGMVEYSIQDLEMPPLMSYVNVLTSYNQPMRKIKITGIDFNYGGVVTMRLHGILVDN